MGFSTAVSGVKVLEASVSTCFTDVLATAPVSADGDLVAAFTVSGVLLVQATSGKRAVYKTTGGPKTAAGAALPFLRFDGVDDVLTDLLITVGASYTLLIVGNAKKRAPVDAAIAQIGSVGTIYNYSTYGHLVQWDGAAQPTEFGFPDYWSVYGFRNSAGMITPYRDDYTGAAITTTALSADTGLSLGAAPSSLFAKIDIAMLLLVPTAALSNGNITTLRAELAAYYGGLPFPVRGTDTLVLWEGNSLLAAGSNATLTANEYQVSTPLWFG